MRQTLKSFADSLGLIGSASNQPDGSVAVIVQGGEGEVTQFVNFCKQGSSLARVDEVVVSEVTQGDYTEFSIS